MFKSTRVPGYGTEYTDNYDWGKDHAETVTWYNINKIKNDRLT